MDVDNFEVETLLTEVEKRPCLWDVHCGGYKSKLERKIAWQEICSALFSGFEGWSEQRKQSMGVKLTSKWRNLRDYYVKINKRNRSKSGFGSRKKMTYLYDCHLRFLSKLFDGNDGAGVEVDDSTLAVKDEPTSGRAGKRRLIVDLRRNLRRNQKPPHQKPPPVPSPVANPDIERPAPDDLTDDPAGDDRAFFESLLPSLKPLAMDEKLDLRLEFIQLIKKARHSHFAKNPTLVQNRGHSAGRSARNSITEASR